MKSIIQEAQDNKDVSTIYKEGLKLSEYHLKYLIGVAGVRLQKDVFDEIVHDSTTMFIEQYFLKNTHEVRYFSKLISLFVKSRLWGARGWSASERRFYNKNVQIGLLEPMLEAPKVEEKEEPSLHFMDILISNKKSSWVLYYLYKCSYYKQAILKIEKLISRKYCYDYCTELHSVWRILHNERNNVS